jgi:hypothetical protein
MRCHPASREDVLSSYAEHLHNYPEVSESAGHQNEASQTTDLFARLHTTMTGSRVVASKVLLLTINAGGWNMDFGFPGSLRRTRTSDILWLEGGGCGSCEH